MSDVRITTPPIGEPPKPVDLWAATQLVLDARHDTSAGLEARELLIQVAADAIGEIGLLRDTVKARSEDIEALLAEPDPTTPHRVRIYAHKPWHAPEYTVSHPASCDALPYGERCWLDRLTRRYDDEMFDPRHDWPDKGRYVATAPAEGESAIRFTLIEEG